MAIGSNEIVGVTMINRLIEAIDQSAVGVLSRAHRGTVSESAVRYPSTAKAVPFVWNIHAEANLVAYAISKIAKLDETFSMRALNIDRRITTNEFAVPNSNRDRRNHALAIVGVENNRSSV